MAHHVTSSHHAVHELAPCTRDIGFRASLGGGALTPTPLPLPATRATGAHGDAGAYRPVTTTKAETCTCLIQPAWRHRGCVRSRCRHLSSALRRDASLCDPQGRKSGVSAPHNDAPQCASPYDDPLAHHGFFLIAAAARRVPPCCAGGGECRCDRVGRASSSCRRRGQCG